MSHSEREQGLTGLLLVIILACVHTPLIIASMLARRLSSKTDLSLRDDVLRSMLRGLPRQVKGYMMTPPNIPRLLDAPRFKPIRATMCEPVSTHEFSGYWVCRGRCVESPRRKVTLLWIHGGAYTLGDALASVPGHVYMVEILASRSVQLDVFSLQYTLAPAATFPTQQNEAVAAYRYLVGEEKIAPGDIVVGGDSAGGHLSLLLLLAVHGEGLERPSGALLAYPWVDLTHSGDSFRRNKDRCMLTRASLEKSVDAVLGGAEGRKKHASVVNFAAPRGQKEACWKDVLPRKTWVNVGADDLFVDDVQAFCRNAERDGAAIELDLSRGKCHGWQTLDDKIGERRYCALGPSEEVSNGLMAGSQNLADGLLKVIEAV
ncbi:alpha/beta-hydrolase [Ophiobolus disseminans]|uniref:Alpha/beta-hydrolase n=1 Tax=Ophiobolus disseminans TaxID=1469910 RepID=A0A6A6ZWQ5_9PLEO|nr:alpha/beta-hydrolase [Ophiobolus disseminans]